MTTFAERLRDLRRAAGLSQTELAGDGISPSYVSLLESGRRRPSPSVAAQLAAKLGCSTSQLLDGEPSERERRVELELAYARLALSHGAGDDALSRLTAMLADNDLAAADEVRVKILLAQAQEQGGDLPAAVGTLAPLFEQTRAQAESALTLADIGLHLCHCYKSTGDFSRAVLIGEQALQACRDEGLAGTDDYFRLAATVMAAYGDLGDEAHALTWARELIAAAEQAGAKDGQAALYWNASVLAEQDGRLLEALSLSQKAIAHLSELDDSRDLARLKLSSGEVLLALDPPRLEEARQALERAYPELRRLGSALDLVEWEYVRSTVALLEEDVPLAESLARSALRRLPEDAGADHLGAVHQTLGDVLAAQGRTSEATEHYRIATDLRSAGHPGRAAALAWRDLAERLRAAGDVEATLRAYRGALDAAGIRDRSKAVVASIELLSSGHPSEGSSPSSRSSSVPASGLPEQH